MLENRWRCKICFSDLCTVCGTTALLFVGTVKNFTQPLLFVRLFPSLHLVLAEYQRKTIFQPVFSDICICTAYAHTHTHTVLVYSNSSLYLSLRYVLLSDASGVNCTRRTAKRN